MNTAITNLLNYAAINCKEESCVCISRHFNSFEASIIISFESNEPGEDSIQFIFDPFHPGNAAASNFDMAVAQRIVILHGGIIYPTVSENTVTFRVTIPREKRSREE